MKFLSALGRGILAIIGDHEFDPDPFKIGGFAAFGLSAFLIFRVLDMVSEPKPDVALVGIVAGLVTVPITMGTYLFGLARKSDQSLIDKGPPSTPNGGALP